MITAARELDTVSGALDGGAADYLIKPFEFHQLRAKLRGVRRARRCPGGRRWCRPIADRLAVRQCGRTLAAGGAAQGPGRRDRPPGAGSGAATRVRCPLPNARTGWGSRASARAATSSTILRTGALEIRLQYGVGRPERRYRAVR